MEYPCKCVRVNLARRVKKFCDVAHSKKSLPTPGLDDETFERNTSCDLDQR